MTHRIRAPSNGSETHRAGFSYVAILMLVTLVSVVALTHVNRASNDAVAHTGRRESIQAEYLARAAANHALYLLLNDNAFPASETQYYMHDLGPGRYGYLVRRHTTTTFATVATLGIVGSTVAERSYVVYVIPP